MNIPSDLMYTGTHEWVRIESDSATIGITDYAQSELGDIVYVEAPEPGRVLKAGDSFATVESVKTVSDIYSPAEGEIIEVNPDLEGNSELINEDPYGRGWIIKMRIEGKPEGLIGAEEYKGLLESEEH